MNRLENAPEHATITDVARHAGVSIKTVSRVTNCEPGVREATRLRVQISIDELNYRPNLYARWLASHKRSQLDDESGNGQF